MNSVPAVRMRGRKATVQREFGPISSDTRRTKAAPFLKWAGGKSQLLEQMRPFLTFPPRKYETYFEPFLGGGAVFFHLSPAKAVLSDSNPELVHVFRVVRDDVEGLMAALDRHYPHRKGKDYYYQIRAQDPAGLTATERAARTIFLNKTCYNGLYRVNAKGQFNVPFGKYKNPTLYDFDTLVAASLALRGKILDVGDYRQVCMYARENDFVYLDPPYQPLSATASFTGYTKDAFSEDDQKVLSGVFRVLDTRGCKVLLSNSATPLVRSLYVGYHIEPVKAKRAINSQASGRGAIDELLIMNY